MSCFFCRKRGSYMFCSLKKGLIKKYRRNPNCYKFVNICTIFDNVKPKGIYITSLVEQLINYTPSRTGKRSMNESRIRRDSLESTKSHANVRQQKSVCCSLASYHDSASGPACILRTCFSILTWQFLGNCSAGKEKTTHQDEVGIAWQRSRHISTWKKSHLTWKNREFHSIYICMAIFTVRREREKNNLSRIYYHAKWDNYRNVS